MTRPKMKGQTMALFTTAQRTLLNEAHALLAKSYVTEQQGIPEAVAKKLVKLGTAYFGLNSEVKLLQYLRDHPILILLQALQYLDDTN